MSSSFSTLDHSMPSAYCNSSNNLRNGWELTVPQAAPEIKNHLVLNLINASDSQTNFRTNTKKRKLEMKKAMNI